MADFILGVDLGQAHDYTALTVLEVSSVASGKYRDVRRAGVTSFDAWGNFTGTPDRMEKAPVYENHYAARHLERLPRGTPYPQQVAHVQALYNRLQALPAYRTTPEGLRVRESPMVSLVVDQTGVGRPVTDMLRAAQLRPVAITITGGDTVTRDEQGGRRVPKRDLVSVAQVLLQSERLKIAKDLLEAQTLINELLAFKVSINLRGHDTYGNDVGEWRENPHDDLVLAVALAAWWGEKL